MFHSQTISFVYFYSSLFKIYFWQKKQSKFQTNKISEMLPHTRKQYFQVLFVVKSVVVVLTWFGVFVLLVDSSSRIRYKQCGFQGPMLSGFCSVPPKVPFQLLSTQLAQSLFVKRKPELDIAGEKWTGGRQERTCQCKTHNYHNVILVCC